MLTLGISGGAWRRPPVLASAGGSLASRVTLTVPTSPAPVAGVVVGFGTHGSHEPVLRGDLPVGNPPGPWIPAGGSAPTSATGKVRMPGRARSYRPRLLARNWSRWPTPDTTRPNMTRLPHP